MSRTVEVRRSIQADPARVWAVLTDAKRLESADTGIARLEGTIALGERIKLLAEVSPDRAFNLRVAEFEPGRRMVWQGGMPLGLFTGRRQFNLEPEGGGTAFHMREDFTGLMAGLIWKSMPDLQPSFEQFADAVRELAETDQRAG